MTSRFNVYDVIAVLVPGAVFLWGIQLPLRIQSGSDYVAMSGGVTEGGIFLLLAYAAGLLIQGLSYHLVEIPYYWLRKGAPSSGMLLRADNRFTEAVKKRIREVAVGVLGITTSELEYDSDVSESVRRNVTQQIFRAFNDALEAKKLSDRTIRFNAQYGLFRAFVFIFLTFTLQCLLWQQGIFGDIQDPGIRKISLLIALMWLVLFVISGLRMHKRAEDFARSVFQTSLVLGTPLS